MNNFKRENLLNFLPSSITYENIINKGRIRQIKHSRNKNKRVILLLSREFRICDNFAFEYAFEFSEKNRKNFVVCLFSPRIENQSKDLFFQRNFQITLRDFNRNGFETKVFYDKKVLEEELQYDVFAVVKDFNPILRFDFANVESDIFEVDARNIVPSWIVSDKKEYSAFSFRRKIYKSIFDFFTDFKNRFQSEECEAKQKLQYFIENNLENYYKFRNFPNKQATSGLSVYMNYGFLAFQRVAIEVFNSGKSQKNIESFLEELIVRKELAENFCFFCSNFKTTECLSNWAKTTLKRHFFDIRPKLFSKEELRNAKTDDPLWNAAQNQLKIDGKIFGYLRMYWAKQIAYWTESVEKAIEIAIEFNDFYAYDAPSANGYVGILWALGGLHDRPFRDFEILGSIRKMTSKNIMKKYPVEDYIKRFSC